MPDLRRLPRNVPLASALLAGLAVLTLVSMIVWPPERHPVPLAPVHKVVQLTPKLKAKTTPEKKPVPAKKEPDLAAVYRQEQAMSFHALMVRWNPLIEEASKRFGVPQSWISAVMRAESGGRLMLNEKQKIISDAGAMGLMQLMPSTYDDMRADYGLGRDPYDPHDNVMAGAAYLRFLRGKYGYPTMFAAYNDGPGNLEDRLRDGGLLPAETRLYLVNVTASVEGRRGSHKAMVQLTRPNGSPILIDCAAVTNVRAALPDEYAPSVLSVVTVGRVKQGVRESLTAAKAIIRSHGGAI